MGDRLSLAPGRQVTPTLRLIEPLGAGGMGAVWLADHQKLKTRVVVKFMLSGLDSSENAKRRFEREASAAAQVKSPHVVMMHDHGVTEEGVPYIVMEHLEGKDLGGWIRDRGALDARDVVTIIVQVAKALTKVHAAGLLHRDIKPDNIFLVDGEDDLFVKLLDFGIAKAHTPEGEDGSLDGGTKTGQVVGTPFYMSPEQVTAQKTIDVRSDLWSLGVVTFEALTGTRPFDGPSFGALAVKIATGSPPKPSEVRKALPPSFDEWFLKACARDPKDRFATAREMADALRVAFEGVVSLPPSAVLSDSGPRGPLSSSSGSKTREPSGSGPKLVDSGPRSADSKAQTNPNPKSQPPSPTFGLASTIKDDPALVSTGKSSPGEAVEAPGFKGGARIAMVVIATIAVGAGAFALNASKEKAPPTHGGGAATSAPIVKSTAAVPSTAPPATSAPAIEPAPTVSVSVSAAPDAGKPIPTRPTGNVVPTTKPTVPPKPTETPTTKPTTTKPASSEPDLF